MSILSLLFIMLSCRSTSEHNTITVVEDFIEINGSEVYTRSLGSGDPIIIIHGGPVLDHSYLLPQMDQLASNYHLIYYDQRACGKSAVDVDTATMTLQGFADDVKMLSDSLGLIKPTILGHSWGGLIAMKYATSYPEHIGKLILSNSIPPNNEEWQEEQKIIKEKVTEDQNQRQNTILSSGELTRDPASAVKKLMLLSFENQFYNITYLDSLQLNIPTDYMTRSAKFQYLGPDLVSFDLYQTLSTLEVPTLIIYGDKEPAAVFSASHMASHFPNCTYEIIENCGHFPFIEQPEDYFTILLQFLE